MVLTGCFFKPSPGDVATDAAVPDVSGYNRIFISSATFDFAARPALAALDTTCQMLATNAGLQGTFIAAAQYAGGPTVEMRLGGASGFVQVNGAFVGNTWADMLAGNILYPIDQFDAPPGVTDLVFTGISAGGGQGPDCAPGTSQGAFGRTNTATQAWYASSQACAAAHVYCVQTDHKQAMLPPLTIPPDGGHVWVTSSQYQGTEVDDTACKRTGGGTGRVLIYDSKGMLRTPPPIGHWYRDDGVFVGTDLATSTIPITTTDDGAHPIETAWSGRFGGGSADSCGDWTSSGTGDYVDLGDPTHVATGTCSEKHQLLCFEDLP